MNLNKLIILLFSLVLFSCESSNINKYISDKDFFKTTNAKENISISKFNYNLDYARSEKFEINKQLEVFTVNHKALPFPSVLKVANPLNLNNFQIVRNVKISSTSQSKKIEISEELAGILDLKSSIYIEYLEKESNTLKSVELSKVTSIVKISNNEIITEEIISKPTQMSEKLNINSEKLNKINVNKLSGNFFIHVDDYSNYNVARLSTNKIRSFSLTISSEGGFYQVLAGPFDPNNVDETLSFLLNNGYNNAKIYN